MVEPVAVQIRLPAEVLAALRERQAGGSDEDRVMMSLALGLFVEGVVSLARAASLAGMTRYEFALTLKRAGLTAYEYGREEHQEDLASLEEG
ncbi:MAG: hypothetical protein HPY83_14205 [Anaerolineae bacterium]|nr:hypothetical protein [Anaerolineae bacterium]